MERNLSGKKVWQMTKFSPSLHDKQSDDVGFKVLLVCACGNYHRLTTAELSFALSKFAPTNTIKQANTEALKLKDKAPCGSRTRKGPYLMLTPAWRILCVIQSILHLLSIQHCNLAIYLQIDTHGSLESSNHDNF